MKFEQKIQEEGRGGMGDRRAWKLKWLNPSFVLQ